MIISRLIQILSVIGIVCLVPAVCGRWGGVDPMDMGSYDHASRGHIENAASRRASGSSEGEVEETIVTQAVYVDRSDPIYQQVVQGGSLHSRPRIERQDSIPSVTQFGSLERFRKPDEGGQYVHVMETKTKYRKNECVCPRLDDAPVMTYIKRIVGSILDQMGVQYHFFGPGETITIDLRGEMSYESFIALEKFLKEKNGNQYNASSELPSVAEIMSHLLHTQNCQPVGTLEYIVEKFFLNLPNMLSPKFWLIMFSVMVLGFVTLILCYQIFYARHQPMKLFFYGIFLFFVFSCVWIYAENAESEQAKNAARMEQYDTIPRDCQYNNFSNLESFGYFFRVKVMGYEDQCVEYYKERNMDHFYRTTPVEALSDAFARLVFHPMGYVGEKVGDFLSAVTHAVPFWMQPIIVTVISVFLFFSMFPYRIRTPLFTIEPAYRPSLPPALSNDPQSAVMERPPAPIVPLHQVDVSTDTIGLEEYILSQMNPGHHEDAQYHFRGIPLRRQWASEMNRFLNILLHHINRIADLVRNFFTKVLRDVPANPNPDLTLPPVVQEIWEEYHIEPVEVPEIEHEVIMVPPPPAEAVVDQAKAKADSAKSIPNDEDEFFPTSCSTPKRRTSSTSRVGRDSGLEDGFPADFDESTLDELLEGELGPDAEPFFVISPVRISNEEASTNGVDPHRFGPTKPH